jgi:hypothetical protein
MRLLSAALAVLACLGARSCFAQSSYMSPDGRNRLPGVTVFCPNGTGVQPCNFGGSSGGGAMSLILGGSPVSSTNRLPVADPALEALISAGAFKVSGSVSIAGVPAVTISGLPPLPAGSNAIGSVSVSDWPATQPVSGAVSITALPPLAAGSNAIGSVAVTNLPATQPISGSVTVSALPSLPAGSNAIGSVSVSNLPATQPVSGTVGISTLPALPAGGNTVGTVNLASGTVGSVTPGGTGGAAAMAVQGIAGGVALPVSGSFYPSVQPVSAASLPLPAGAATAALQSAALAPVAPGTASATQSLLVGCQANTTLPSFTAGQQGAVPCDTSGRLYVVTVPSANNVPGFLQAVSAGGASTFSAVNAAASCMATNVKSSSGMVFAYSFSNTNSSGVWVRLFASGTAPGCGSGTPGKRIYVPAGSTVGLSTDLGWVFAGGIGFDVTSGSGADTDSTTVAAANSVMINIDYK